MNNKDDICKGGNISIKPVGLMNEITVKVTFTILILDETVIKIAVLPRLFNNENSEINA